MNQKRKDAALVVCETIERHSMLAPNESVLIGLSGGADSVCLTHILCGLRKSLGIKISAVYINHNLREKNIIADEISFVKDFCKGQNIDCEIVSIDVCAYADKHHLSTEEAGRKMRYEILNHMAYDKVALAHHADDVAETVMLNLFRGTGVKGAAGIMPVIAKNDRVFIRPLYELYRADIETYLSQNNLSFCLDRSNLGNDYTRNRIRNNILPQAKLDVCLAANRNIYAYARKMRVLSDYLEEVSADFFAVHIVKTDKGYLLPDKLCTQIHSALRPEIILYTIDKLIPYKKNIGEVHINDILLLFTKGRKKFLCLPAGLRAVRVTGGVELYASGEGFSKS